MASRRLVSLEAVGQVGLDLRGRVVPAAVLIRLLGCSQIGLQPQDLLLILDELRLGVGDLLFQSLHFDLFLGDHMHVLADLGHQLLNHLPRVIDFKTDRYAVLNRIVDVAQRGADIAERIPPKKHDSSQKHGCGGNDDFLDHDCDPPFWGVVG